MSRYAEILVILQKSNPSLQFYTIPNRTAIGYWNHTLNRVQVLVAELMGGAWASMPELLINEKPAIPQDSWEPCKYESFHEVAP